MESIGNLPLGRWETRKRIYNYWEGIHKKHKDVVDAFEKFNKDIDKIKPKKGDDFMASMKEVRDFYKKHSDVIIPNYVFKLQPFSMKLEDSHSTALILIGKFLELKGISEDEDIKGEVEGEQADDEVGSEGVGGSDRGKSGAYAVGESQGKYTGEEMVDRPKFVETASMNPAEKEIIDETRNINLKEKEGKPVPVDPIFWYKYHDNY